MRLERFRALYRAFADIDPAWKTLERPFSRPSDDPSTMLRLVTVGAQASQPRPPTAVSGMRAHRYDVPTAGTRGLKMSSRTESSMPRGSPNTCCRDSPLNDRRASDASRSVNACLVRRQRKNSMTPWSRSAHARDSPHSWTLERAGVRRPATYALSGATGPRDRGCWGPRAGRPAVAQFQGTLLLLERMSRTGTIPASGIDGLVSSLCMLETTSGRYDGALAAWIETTLLPALPPQLVIQPSAREQSPSGSCGHGGGQPALRVGRREVHHRRHRASLRDLVAIRAKQGGNSLDAVMALTRALTPLQQNGLTLDALKTHTASLEAAGDRLVAARAWPDMSEDVPDVKKIVERAGQI